MQFKSIIILIIALVAFTVTSAQQIAFPGAEGYGKFTKGGRGGKVYEVSNLNDSGAGSLRAAVEASGPRTVVFRISGTIELTQSLSISNPYITIAGQTAPGDGICLKNYPLDIKTNQVIVRYISVRMGDETNEDTDAISSRYYKNIILDHLTASWSVDETMSVYNGDSTTIQWCLVSESMFQSNHVKGSHGFGGIWGGNKYTCHHNLLAHHSSRNPRFSSGCGYTDYINNVVYNWGYMSCYGAEKKDTENPAKFSFTEINMLNNYYKPGPATTISIFARPSTRDGLNDLGKWYVDGNYFYGNSTLTNNNWKGVTPDGGISYTEVQPDIPFEYMPIEMQSAEEAYNSVLDNVGSTLPKRDPIDKRIVAETKGQYATFEGFSYKTLKSVPDKSKKCGMIDSQKDVGGWPILNSLPAPTDTDHDGMPDDWEDANGLDKNLADDRNIVTTDGYTMLEVYLNSIEFNHPVKLNQFSKSGDSDVNITWTDSYIAEDGFIIEKSTDGINYTKIDSVGRNVKEYIDKNQTIDQNLKYRIVAFQNNFVTPYTIENTSIEILPVDTPIIVGEIIQLQVVCNPENSTFKDVTWELRPEDTSKARIDAMGNLTALGAGTVQLTATTTDGTNLKAQVEIQLEIIEIVSIELLPVDTLYVGDIVQLEVNITPENPTFKDLEWEIYPEDVAVAIISTAGKFYARGAGKVQVTATAKDGTNKQAQIDIVIENKVGINNLDINKIEFKCYPNPSSEELTFEWYCPENSEVSIDIFDLNGKKVCRVLEEKLKQGNYTTLWNGLDHNGGKILPGLYLCIININDTKNIHSIIRN